tara:strand:+ start:22731 stop:23246 length:516 start_codon:yes stop_codon:yes gene_type:complete
MKKLIITLVILLGIIVIFFGEEKKMEAPPRMKPVPAPQFSLHALTGEKISLSDFHSRPLLVNFWATWCVPCRNEMPMMESVSKSLKEEGLVVLAINLKEDKDIVQEYIREGRFTFRVLLDKSGDVSDKFQVFGLPSTYFIDKKGIIQYNFMGEMTKEIINTGLKAISVKGV